MKSRGKNETYSELEPQKLTELAILAAWDSACICSSREYPMKNPKIRQRMRRTKLAKKAQEEGGLFLTGECCGGFFLECFEPDDANTTSDLFSESSPCLPGGACRDATLSYASPGCACRNRLQVDSSPGPSTPFCRIPDSMPRAQAF